MGEEVARILLVEDNVGDVYLFRKALENAGVKCELMVIEDGGEALAFVRGEGAHSGRKIPDLAVLDLNLPKNSGIEVLTAIRGIEDFVGTPIVIASSSAYPRDRAKTEELGVSRYIRKPADLDDFMQIGIILKEILELNRSAVDGASGVRLQCTPIPSGMTEPEGSIGNILQDFSPLAEEV